MYTTGGLGRYLQSGNVDRVGRADDQVKIRGFMIELNEIGINLSQNALIRDCKTLVRRDHNEGRTLVYYIVPEVVEWRQFLATRGMQGIEDEGIETGAVAIAQKKYRVMQNAVREHLKKCLPAYALPTIYIVLNRLSLNPNGKVDKSNLPFPDVAERVEDASEDLKNWVSLSKMRRTVAQKWAALVHGLNPKYIRPEDSFFDLGGHSLLNFRRELQADLTIDALYGASTLAGFNAEVEKQLRKTGGVAIEGG